MPAVTKIQFRRGTAAQWTSANPVLADGEMGIETDTKKFKFGDGTLTWNALPYASISSVTAAQISDASGVGRSVITAADAAAARSAIGAGTSSLMLGTTASTAKAGNWVPSFAEVTGTLGTNQLPPLAINDTFPVADQASMLALNAQRGDIAIRTDVSKSFILSSDSPSTLADWKELVSTGAVLSVAGKTGAVTLAKDDVGLGNVDNTSDVSKPVSTAQQTALNAKANLASPTFTGTVGGITKAMVGLDQVDNTSDLNKPVSNAQSTALAGKENSIALGTTGQYWRGDKTWQPLSGIVLSAVDGGTP